MPNAYDDLLVPQATEVPSGQANAYADLVPGHTFGAGHLKKGPDPFAIPRTSPLYGESESQMMLEGIGRGFTDVGRHIGSLVGMESPEDLARAREIDQPLMSQPAGRFGSAVGTTAALTPAAMAGGAGLGALGAGPVTTGAVLGAGQGALMSDPGSRGMGALVGGATGAAMPLAGTAASKLAYGLNRTPEAQQLMDQGVRLTPGQMNPEGVWNKIEENVRGVPIIGNVVEHARTGAQQDFQRGVIEEASAPGYSIKSTSKDPNELFQEAQDSYKPLYQAASGFPVKPIIPTRNQTLAYALRQAANNKAIGAGASIRGDAQDFLEGQMQAIHEKAQTAGGWKSDDLIKLRSGINEEIRGAGVDQAGKKYAQLLRGARDKVTESINTQIPPDAAAALQTANDAYPKLAIIRDAIKRGGDQSQGFTPAQLSAAVKNAAENNEYARGGGLMRDWSSAGREIFTERNPKTGASHATTGSLAGAAYALHHFVPGAQVPAALGSLGALGMIGTQTGREILGGQTAPQQAAQRLAEGLQRITTPGQRQIVGAVGRTALPAYAVPAYARAKQKDQQQNDEISR